MVSHALVGSYPAFPSLPPKRRYLSVALSLGSPPAAVSRYSALWGSDFPRARTFALRPQPPSLLAQAFYYTVNSAALSRRLQPEYFEIIVFFMFQRFCERST